VFINPEDLTHDDLFDMLAAVRHHGFAVCAFTPEELRGAEAKYVEASMIERGWDAIDTLATEPHPDEEDE
jgi:hypothetical protein